MNKIKDFILNDALTYLGGVSFTACIIALIYFLFKIASQHVFNRNLTKYTGEIEAELEKIKFQYQRTYKDFELYTLKKHDKYPEMFHLLEIAFGSLMQLKINYYYTFNNVNEKDLTKYFQEELKMTEFDQERVLKIWRDNTEAAKSEIWVIEKRVKYDKAKNKWFDANDFYLSNHLYFSEEVIQVIKNHLENMYEHLQDLDPLYIYSGEELKTINEKNDRMRKTVLPSSRENVRDKMKNELRIT